LHLHTKGLVPDRGWESPRTGQDRPCCMDGSQERTEFAQKERSISGPSSWDPRRPPLGTAQVQLGGVYGNYFLELIIILKLFLGTDFDTQ